MAETGRPMLRVSHQGSAVDVTPGQPWYAGIGAACNIRLPITGPAEPWFVIRHAGVWTIRAVDDQTAMWLNGIAIPSDRSVRIGTTPSQQLRAVRGAAEVVLSIEVSAGPGAGSAPSAAPSVAGPSAPGPAVAGPSAPGPALTRSAAEFLVWASAHTWPGFLPIPGTKESGIVIGRSIVSVSRSVVVTPGRDGEPVGDAAGRTIHQLLCPHGEPFPPGYLRDEGMLLTSSGRLLVWSVILQPGPSVIESPPPPVSQCMTYPMQSYDLPEDELWRLLHATAERHLQSASPAGFAGPARNAGSPAAEPRTELEPAPGEPEPAPQPEPPPELEPEPETQLEPAPVPEPETEPVAPLAPLKQWNTPAVVSLDHPSGATSAPTRAPIPAPGTERTQPPGGVPSTPASSTSSASSAVTKPPPASADAPNPGAPATPVPAPATGLASDGRWIPWWRRGASSLPETITGVNDFVQVMQQAQWPGAVSLPGSLGRGVVLSRSINVGDQVSPVDVDPDAEPGATVYERFRPNGGRFPTGFFREEGLVLATNGRLYRWQRAMDKYASVFDAPPEPLGRSLDRDLKPATMDDDELLPMLTVALERAGKHVS